MNVTLALDDEVVARAREVAREQGTTLNEMIRRHLDLVAGRRTGQAVADQLQSLWDETPGHSGGSRFTRDDAYEGRL